MARVPKKQFTIRVAVKAWVEFTVSEESLNAALAAAPQYIKDTDFFSTQVEVVDSSTVLMGVEQLGVLETIEL